MVFVNRSRQLTKAVNGAGSYEKYLENIREYTNDAWSELLFLRADLSSK